MTDLIARELREIAIMAACGAALMMLFDVRNNIVIILRIKGRLKWFAHILSWICAAFLFSEFLYKANYGVLKWYVAVSFIVGIMLWKKIVCDTILLSIGMRKNENIEDKKDRDDEET